MIERLRQKYKDQNIAVLYLYINSKDARNQTIENLVGSLFKQLIESRPDDALPPELKEMYRKAKKKKTWPQVGEIRDLLKSELESFDRTYLIVDAWDETPSPEALLAEVQDLQETNVSLMITYRSHGNEQLAKVIFCNRCSKRPLLVYYRCLLCKKDESEGYDLCQSCYDKNPHCEDMYHDLYGPDQVKLEIKATNEDIGNYVDWELERQSKRGMSKRADRRIDDSGMGTTSLGDLCRAEPSLKAEIRSAIVEKAEGRFLNAKLYMESLKSKLSSQDISDALATLPNKVDDSYEETMQRLEDDFEPDQVSTAKRLLSWIVCTHRQLSWVELEQAMAVRLGDSDFNPRRRLQPDHLLRLTAGLITIDTMKDGAVSLVHSSAQEYFERNRKKWFGTALTDISIVTLTYLNFETFLEPCQGKDEDIDFNNRLRKHPFLSYASQFWGLHAYEEGCGPAVGPLILQLVNNPGRLASAVQAAFYLDSRNATSWDVRKGVNSLHVCAWFGLHAVIPDLVKMGVALNGDTFIDAQDLTYKRSALMYASRKGHPVTAAKLLELGASVNLRSKDQNTALFEAVVAKQAETVRVLLRKKELDINAMHPRKYNRTALMLAAHYGYKEIVDVLLTREDISLNQQDQEGYTALSLAASAGRSAIVDVLLSKRGIEVDLVDKDGGSALIIAAVAGNNEIVEKLLNRNADTSIADKEGGSTALLQAINNGHVDVVQTILTHNMDEARQFRNITGRTLLHGACVNQQNDIARLLISAGLDPNAQGNRGETPLHDACRADNGSLIETLLEFKADRTIMDNHGRTPRDVAWQHGNLEALAILEDQTSNDTDRDSNEYPNASSLPLWAATAMGRTDLVRAIISSGTSLTDQLFDPDTQDTALHIAVSADEIETLALLLEAGLDVNAANNTKRTPLHIAAFWNRPNAADLLIKHKAHLELLDQWNTTPLMLARNSQNWDVAMTLIEANAVIDTETAPIQTLFFMAVNLGSLKAVKRLLQCGAETQAKSTEGLTALQMATMRGYGEMMQVLRINKTFKMSPGASESTGTEADEHEAEDEGNSDEESRKVLEAFKEGPPIMQDPFQMRPRAQTTKEIMDRIESKPLGPDMTKRPFAMRPGTL